MVTAQKSGLGKEIFWADHSVLCFRRVTALNMILYGLAALNMILFVMHDGLT